MAVSLIFFSIIIALVILVVYYFKQHFLYWKLRGVPYETPVFLYGNLKGIGKIYHLREIIQAFYERFKKTGPFGGFFFFFKTAVVIFDLNLARDILIKDFNNFPNRGYFSNKRDDPLTGNLVLLDGPKWKLMRSKLSSIFSSGKIKGLFSTLLAVGSELNETIDKMIRTDPIIEVKDILSRFTLDIIGTSAFGIECNSLKDPNAEFRMAADKAFSKRRHNKLVDGIITSFPVLAEKLGMRVVHEEVHQFFMRVVREMVEYREKNSIKRNDFMNLLIELKNNTEIGLTIGEVAAQSYVFFLAGFESSSGTMGFALYELASNQAIQDKLRSEINVQYEKNQCQFTYESMAEMNYMEMVMKETLRKYSVVVNITRKALANYPTSDPKYVIPKGTMVIIPGDAIHRDPDIYPEPEKFDPERFSQKEVEKRHPFTWLPFGDGPRNCIGQRFGKMQIFIGLSILLRQYKFHFCSKTPIPLVPSLKNRFMSSKEGIFLRVERIR